MQLFYFILFQIKILIKLLYEICYPFHQIMILLRLFLKTACMLYVSLPVLLTVKSLVFNFPTVPSSTHDLLRISFRDLQAGYPRIFSYLLFLVSQHFFSLYNISDLHQKPQTVSGSDIQFHLLHFLSPVMPGIPVLWMQHSLLYTG